MQYGQWETSCIERTKTKDGNTLLSLMPNRVGAGRSFCSCLTSIVNFSKRSLNWSIPVELCEEIILEKYYPSLVDFEAVNSYGFLFFGNQPVHRGSRSSNAVTTLVMPCHRHLKCDQFNFLCQRQLHIFVTLSKSHRYTFGRFYIPRTTMIPYRSPIRPVDTSFYYLPPNPTTTRLDPTLIRFQCRWTIRYVG